MLHVYSGIGSTMREGVYQDTEDLVATIDATRVGRSSAEEVVSAPA